MLGLFLAPFEIPNKNDAVGGCLLIFSCSVLRSIPHCDQSFEGHWLTGLIVIVPVINYY